MGKKGRHKTRKRLNKSVEEQPTTEEQKKLTRIIGNIAFFLVLTPFLIVNAYPARGEMSDFGRDLQSWCAGIFIFSAISKIFINREVRLLGEVFSNERVHAKFRRLLIVHLATSIFGNLVILIPVLYFKGYITQWATYLPGADIVEDKTAIAVSFCVAAIVSSIAGNSAYDVVKHFVLKSFRKNLANDGKP